MISTNGKVIVKVNPSQKDNIKIGDAVLSTANRYEINYRYKSPTIAEVVEGNQFVKAGDVLVCHHNLFYLPSPYHLFDDIFSVPFSKVLFATINKDGDLSPICGNMICEEIPIETVIDIPDDEKQVYKNKYKIISPGWTKYKIGDTIFTRPSSGYTIIYNWNNEEKKAVKVSEDMICGVLK